MPFYFTCPEENNKYIGDEVIEETEKEDSAFSEEYGKFKQLVLCAGAYQPVFYLDDYC